MVSALILIADIISAAAALALAYFTIQPCKVSGISYLLCVPAGFALVAVGFIVSVPSLLITSSLTNGFETVSLLTQTYGLLLLALTYARRTRFMIIGQSIILEIAIPVLVTIGVVTYALVVEGAGAGLMASALEMPLRLIMGLSTLYLIYETIRNWSLTQKASEGVVAVAFVFLFIEQLGFLLVFENFGDIATFVGYEGRLIGLFILIAVTGLKIRREDASTVLKRLGLTALAH
ncbi:MAG TPA: hypothetical protein VLV18_02320 [Terriglobales bacterium]|nr:hypothetical protein [Terriglobales bacterium]